MSAQDTKNLLVELVCEECKGTRYKSSILDIKYDGKNIHEVLQLTVREAMAFFHAAPRLVQRLKVLDDVGLVGQHLREAGIPVGLDPEMMWRAGWPQCDGI